jgi:hypothetical protein
MEMNIARSEEEKDQVDRLNEKIRGLSCDLLKERITRIDFQMQLLSEWRQRCQQELNRLLAPEENR